MKKIVTGFSTLSIMGVSTAYLISCTVPVNEINLGISPDSVVSEKLYAKWDNDKKEIQDDVAPEDGDIGNDTFTALNKNNNLSKFIQSTINAFFYSDSMHQTNKEIIETKTTFRGDPEDQTDGVVVSVDGQSSRAFENVSQEQYYSMFNQTHITSFKGLYELYKFGLDSPEATIFNEEGKAITEDFEMINEAIGQEDSDADKFFKNFLEGYSNSGFTDIDLSFGGPTTAKDEAEGDSKSTYIEGKKSVVTLSIGTESTKEDSTHFYNDSNYTEKEFGTGIYGNFEADPAGVRVIGASEKYKSLDPKEINVVTFTDSEEYDKAVKIPNENQISVLLEAEKNGDEPTELYKKVKDSSTSGNNYMNIETGPVTFEMKYTTEFADLSGNESAIGADEYQVDVTILGLQAKFVPRIVPIKEKESSESETKDGKITTENFALVWDFAGYTYNNVKYTSSNNEESDNKNLDKFNKYKNDKFEGMEIDKIEINKISKVTE